MSGIYTKMIAIMNDIGAVGKTERNQQQGWMYRGVHGLVDHIHPLCAKHGVFLTSDILDVQQTDRVTRSGSTLIYTRIKVKYTFCADDKSTVSSVVCAEAMDSGDKSTIKAMSIALKYCIGQTFLVPYEMVDPDKDTHEVVSNITASQIDEIIAKASELGIEEDRIWTWAKKVSNVDQIVDIPSVYYDRIMSRLQKSKNET